MHLNYCRSIRHHIKVGDRELRVTACPNGSLGLSDLSAESGLHLGMPCELQKNPAQRDRRGLMSGKQNRTDFIHRSANDRGKRGQDNAHRI